MRKLTATVTAYKFNELSPDIQKKLTDDQTILHHFDPQLHELILEDYTRDLKELSLPDLTPVFSLNALQGDGVAFKGTISINKLPSSTDTPTGIRDTLQVLQPDDKYPQLRNVINRIEAEYPGSSKLTVAHLDNSGTHTYSFKVELQLPTTHDEIYDEYQHAFERGITTIEPDEAFNHFAREETAYNTYVLEQLRNISRTFERHGYELVKEHTSEATAREALLDMNDRLYLEDGRPVPKVFLDQNPTS